LVSDGIFIALCLEKRGVLRRMPLFLRSFEKGKPMFQHTGRHIKRRPMKVKAYISIFYTPTEKNTMNCLLNLY